jgi:predicted Zn-ribbon and HTH transcriptional regulator
MDKETLIIRFKEKRSSRKKLLFSLYSEKISSYENLEAIASEINIDLGVENLIKRADIKYCRFQFADKKSLKLPKIVPKKQEESISKTKEMKWTNPDTIEKITLKSKFAAD